MVVATVIFLGVVEVTHQTLQVEVDPSRNRLEGSTTLTISQGGDLAYDLHPAASLHPTPIPLFEVTIVYLSPECLGPLPYFAFTGSTSPYL